MRDTHTVTTLRSLYPPPEALEVVYWDEPGGQLELITEPVIMLGLVEIAEHDDPSPDHHATCDTLDSYTAVHPFVLKSDGDASTGCFDNATECGNYLGVRRCGESDEHWLTAARSKKRLQEHFQLCDRNVLEGRFYTDGKGKWLVAPYGAVVHEVMLSTLQAHPQFSWLKSYTPHDAFTAIKNRRLVVKPAAQTDTAAS